MCRASIVTLTDQITDTISFFHIINYILDKKNHNIIISTQKAINLNIQTERKEENFKNDVNKRDIQHITCQKECDNQNTGTEKNDKKEINEWW